MKRTILGLLIISLVSLISFTPAFAEKGSMKNIKRNNSDDTTAGTTLIKDIEPIKATDEMSNEIETNLDNTKPYNDASDSNTKE